MNKQFILRVKYPNKRGYDFEYIITADKLIRQVAIAVKNGATRFQVYNINKISEYNVQDSNVEVEKLFESSDFFRN